MWNINMDINAIGIPIMFIVMGAIMLWFLLSGKRLWWLKATFVAVCCFVVFLLWHSVSFLSGWPTERQLSKKFEIHWIVVDEGTKGKDNGKIFVWATPLNDDYTAKKSETTEWWKFRFVPDKRKRTPVAYELPYSRELHEQAMKALEAIRKGRRIVGERGEGDGEGGGLGRKGKGKGEKGKGNPDLYHYTKNKNKMMFYDFPPAKLPPKPTEPQKPNFDGFRPIK